MREKQTQQKGSSDNKLKAFDIIDMSLYLSSTFQRPKCSASRVYQNLKIDLAFDECTD
jgi:hypothetical protein